MTKISGIGGIMAPKRKGIRILGFSLTEVTLGGLLLFFLFIGISHTGTKGGLLETIKPTITILPPTTTTSTTIKPILLPEFNITRPTMKYPQMARYQDHILKNESPTTSSTTTTSLPANISLDRYEIKQILNIRPRSNTTMTYQDGYQQCKRDVLVIAGLKPKRYNLEPTYIAPPTLAGGSSEMVCFYWKQKGYSFHINGSTWGIKNKTDFYIVEAK